MVAVCEYLCYFFFQAEDGIRDYKVTGVQTCALPIYRRVGAVDQERWSVMNDNLKYSHNILDKLEGCYWESEPSSLK